MYNHALESYLKKREEADFTHVEYLRGFQVNFHTATTTITKTFEHADPLPLFKNATLAYRSKLLQSARLAIDRAWVDLTLFAETLRKRNLDPQKFTDLFFQDITSVQRLILEEEAGLHEAI